MFQTKNFASIVAAMVAHMRATQSKVTDFRVGGVARTLVEAPAIEIDEFYQRVLYGLLEAIPTAVYHAFDFDELPAAMAGGTVRFSAAAPVVSAVAIPLGTILQRPDTRQRFVTTEAGQIAGGQQHGTVRVRAEYAGIDGNAPTGTVTLLLDYLPQVVAVTNLAPIVGGADAETPDERKARFVDYVGSLSRGTVWAVAYAARKARLVDSGGLTTEYVTRVGMAEGAGHADIYIYGSGGQASQELLDVAQAILDGSYDAPNQKWIPGYRPVGVNVQAMAMIEHPVDVTLRIRMLAGVALDAGITNKITDKLSALLFSISPGDVLYVEQLIDAALAVPGVERVVCENDANTPCAVNNVLTLGTLTVEALSA